MVDYEVQRLNQLCLPRWYDRIYSKVVRPERPEFFEILTGLKANPRWTRALERLLLAINNTKCQRPSLSIEKEPIQEEHRKRPHKLKKWWETCMAPADCADRFEPKLHPRSQLETFIQGLDGFEYPDDIAKPVLGAIALILYDQECDGMGPRNSPNGVISVHNLPPPPTSTRKQRKLQFAYQALVKHMLLVDYKVKNPSRPHSLKHFKRYRQGLIPTVLDPIAAYLTQFVGRIRDGDQDPDKLPSLDEWRALAARIITIRSFTDRAPETALMLYHYHTQRSLDVLETRPTSQPQKHEPRLTGYTGMIEKLVDQAKVNHMPSKGRDRLLRKLSVDLLIFTEFRYPVGMRANRLALQKAIRLIADQCLSTEGGRKSLHGPSVKPVISIPEFDQTHRDGYTKEDKKLLLRKNRGSSLGAYFHYGNKRYYPGEAMSRKQRGFDCFDHRLLATRSVSAVEVVFNSSVQWEFTDEENARRLERAKIAAGRQEEKSNLARAKSKARRGDVPEGGNTAYGLVAGCKRAECCKAQGCQAGNIAQGPSAPNGNVSNGIRILSREPVNDAGLNEGWIDKPSNDHDL